MMTSSHQITSIHTRPNRHTPPAFTLVELLVVIGIIAVLIGILLPTLGRAREQAKTAACQSQMRQLGNALVMYTNENKGFLPGSDTTGPLAQNNPRPTYIGWVDGGPTSNFPLGNTDQATTNGTLFKYLKNPSIYRCPAEQREVRLRSYSLNSYFNPQDTSWPMLSSYTVRKISEVRRSSECIAFAEEPDPRYDWNVNGFFQNPFNETGVYPGFPDGSANNRWEDVVSSWHVGGAVFAFADGHAEYWRWRNRETVNYAFNASTKGWPSWRLTGSALTNPADLERVRRAIVTWDRKR